MDDCHRVRGLILGVATPGADEALSSQPWPAQCSRHGYPEPHLRISGHRSARISPLQEPHTPQEPLSTARRAVSPRHLPLSGHRALPHIPLQSCHRAAKLGKVTPANDLYKDNLSHRNESKNKICIPNFSFLSKPGL